MSPFSTELVVDSTSVDVLLDVPGGETLDERTNAEGGDLSREQRSAAFGRLIRRRRGELGLSLADVAAHSGIDDSYWSKLENGKVTSPTPRTLKQIARTLGLDAADLYALCGYEVPERLPAFEPYLRAKYELPPEAVADLERYFTQLRAFYGIAEDAPVFPPRKLAAPTKEERQARTELTRANKERERLLRLNLKGELPDELLRRALADSSERIRRAEARLDVERSSAAERPEGEPR